jgi:hypothetical protein
MFLEANSQKKYFYFLSLQAEWAGGWGGEKCRI